MQIISHVAYITEEITLLLLGGKLTIKAINIGRGNEVNLAFGHIFAFKSSSFTEIVLLSAFNDEHGSISLVNYTVYVGKCPIP